MSQVGSLRIIVVDDNADTARTLARLLAAFGHEVQITWMVHRRSKPPAPPNPTSCSSISACPVWRVTRSLRKEQELQRAVLIAVSGYGRERDGQQTHDAGFDHYLIKPVDYQKLLELFPG
jgi:CheY-like chemotaxis protein